jgi:seryl-tRNA synthetase
MTVLWMGAAYSSCFVLRRVVALSSSFATRSATSSTTLRTISTCGSTQNHVPSSLGLRAAAVRTKIMISASCIGNKNYQCSIRQPKAAVCLSTYLASSWSSSSSSSSSPPPNTNRHRLNLKLSSSSSSSSTSSPSINEDISSGNSNTAEVARIPRGDVSGLDARTVVEHLDMVLSHLRSRHASAETILAAKEIASLNEQRVVLIRDRDRALQIRKEQSAIVGRLMRDKNSSNKSANATTSTHVDGGQISHLLEEAKSLSNAAANDASRAEEELARIERTMEDLLLCIPNILDDVVPEGKDDTENEIVEEWGDIHALPKELGWEVNGDKTTTTVSPKWHDDVALGLTKHGWLADQAVKISGARFMALGGVVARLERALSQFFLDLHTTRHGYTELSVPYIVSRSTLEGTSQLPKFEDDLFKIESHTCNGEDAFLIPTAEVPVTNLYRDTILDEADLPLSFTALTPCFRAEAGSYGRDTRGLVRTHQFHKVELVKITRPEDSDAEHESLTRHAQACLEALKLPYRKVRLCSGDIGFSARHCYDLEVWLPGQGVYKEISSCSNTGDFQAKRMGLRYRPSSTLEDGDAKTKKQGGGGGGGAAAKKVKPRPCHTINGSGLAVGRALVAVLENYQKPDGSVVVPEVLRPYMGGLEILKVSV